MAGGERKDAVRVDQWLWGVRMFKTRSLATDACRGGHVRVNGAVAKPATPVRIGDRVEGHVHGRERILEVVRLVDKRVGAPAATECMVDHSPPPPPKEEYVPPLFARERGAGRPTKRDRRDLDRLHPKRPRQG
ncbi:MAG TPA: RNA-binding S4 domain-containing protein [Acidimicrobiales bacterium]|nr:RNA-binding S4 domain-containing protein [Acidimicrobiales bacterium]